MDKFIDARFERLEKALGSLIDSVTKYHPSATLVEELKVADTELANGLEQVQTHQSNRLRILELRQKSSSLDHQIRETLTSLAQTRQEVVATPTTKFPSGPSYPIVYEELLSYARRISKTTMPPAATIHASSATTVPASGMQTPTVGESQSQAVTPAAGGATPGGGTITTAAATPVAVGSGTAAGTTTPLIPMQSPRIVNGTPRPSTAGLPSASPSALPPPQPPQQQQQQPSITGLPEHMAQYLNPLSGQVFFPWPPEDKIRSGSLASNQILLEQGIDPCGYDPAAEEARRKQADAERREREEREARAQEERARQMHEERERLRRERERLREKEQDEWRRASIAAGAGAGGSSSTADGPGSGGGGAAAAASRGGPEKRQFQFTNLDDLDDDDDDEED